MVNPNTQNLKVSTFLKQLKHYLINGEKCERIKFKSHQGEPEVCMECGVRTGKLHIPGCTAEISPCNKHNLVMECDCPVHPGEAV